MGLIDKEKVLDWFFPLRHEFKENLANFKRIGALVILLANKRIISPAEAREVLEADSIETENWSEEMQERIMR